MKLFLLWALYTAAIFSVIVNTIYKNWGAAFASFFVGWATIVTLRRIDP